MSCSIKFCKIKWNLLNKICILWTILSIVYLFLNYLNLVPFYETKWIKKNSIIPKINLFPGQKVKLTYDSVEYIESDKITSAKWTISQNKKTIYTSSILSPTIPIPPTNPGIYNLGVTLILGNIIIEGASNINVVSNEIEPIVANESHILTLPINHAALSSTKNKNEIEMYIGNNWVKKSLIENNNQETIKINKGDTIFPINNSVIIRSASDPENLDTYKVLPLK